MRPPRLSGSAGMVTRARVSIVEQPDSSCTIVSKLTSARGRTRFRDKALRVKARRLGRIMRPLR